MRRVDYLFWKLAEEASEVTQAVSKVMCFGPKEVYAPVGVSNVARLVDELNDCIAVVQMLQAEGALPMNIENPEKIAAKKSTVEHWLKHSISLGVVTTPADTWDEDDEGAPVP